MDADKLAVSATTDGQPPRPGFEHGSAPAPINPKTGQHEAYWVLSAEERAKGFVRPVRRSYIHVGRSVCGKALPKDDKRLGGPCLVCVLPPGHDGECSQWSQESQPDAARAEREHILGGCGCQTSMGQAIAETYARDPKYYGATFCCHCGAHFPVGERGEFVWLDAPEERVGT